MKMQSVKVVNKITGEIYELEYSTIIEAKNAYLEIKGMLDAFDRAKRKILSFVDETLGEDERFDFGDGYQAQRIVGGRKVYQRSIVAQYLDPDQMDLVTDINGRKLKELMSNLVSEGAAPAGAWKDIEANADITPVKPYVKIIKL